MSVMLDYWTRLDQRPSGSNYRLPYQLGPNFNHFKQAGWISPAGYLAAIGDEFDFSEEVDVEEIDEDAGIFRHIDPQHRWSKIEKALASITLYEFRENAWLDELAKLMAIDTRQLPKNRVLVPRHLWHLGHMRIQGSHNFAPVFIARLAVGANLSELNVVLADPIRNRGVVLHINPPHQPLLGDHAFRPLSDFLYAEDGQERFDLDALDRVMRGYMATQTGDEPLQYIQGLRVKLPHFQNSRTVSETRAQILKLMWGDDDELPPAMKWAEVNVRIASGYRSFDEAFGDKATREDFLTLVKTGGYYQVRRH